MVGWGRDSYNNKNPGSCVCVRVCVGIVYPSVFVGRIIITHNMIITKVQIIKNNEDLVNPISLHKQRVYKQQCWVCSEYYVNTDN